MCIKNGGLCIKNDAFNGNIKGLIAKARQGGADAYIYNNEVAVIDLPAHRVRTFPWQLWRTNYAYPVSRHAGFQGSLSWCEYVLTLQSCEQSSTIFFGLWRGSYRFGLLVLADTLTGWFGSDPYKNGNVLCGKPLGHSAHPVDPKSTDAPCLAERAAGEWFELYPPTDNDVCHKGPVTSIRWELMRQGLEVSLVISRIRSPHVLDLMYYVKY